jgi:flagellar motor switch protein FliM
MDMAADSLSQSEIDALFSSGGGEPPRSTSRRSAAEVRLYDFQRPSRISKDQLRSLHAIYGMVTKGMEGWFAGRIPDSITVEVENVEPLTFGEFSLALPTPCASYVLHLGPISEAPAVVEIGRDFAFYLVDRFLGGAESIESPERSLTMVERAMVQLMVNRIAFHVKDAWHDHVPLDPEVSGFESVPEMLQFMTPEDPVLVAHLKVQVHGMSSLVLICLPFPALEKFFTGGAARRLSASRGTEEERREERIRMADHVRRSGLPVSARFPAFEVPLGLLAELKEGSLLATGFSPDTELEVRVAGLDRYVGKAGRRGKHRALSILRASSADAATAAGSHFTNG